MSDLEQDAPYDARLDLVLSLAVKKGADGILISNLPDIRWACGFTGSSGLLLVLQGSRTLITDGRYTHQAGMEVVGADVLIAANDVLDEMDRFSVNRLAIQSDHVTGDVRSRLEKVLLKTELRPVTRFLEHLRAEKNAEEIANIREALRISER
ncbi:MAG: aminopeptidase P family N-terminal domain-containing protein, partial [Bacteroidetes bacterium]|nr:aminopeptidase P family N-terminal domain-containing protein [Bacteroidota bacterium]